MKKSTPLIVGAGILAGFAATSHLAFHRSAPATLLDGYQRGKRLKSRFAEQTGYDQFLRLRAEENERPYELPRCFRPQNALTHEISQGMDVISLRPAEARKLLSDIGCDAELIERVCVLVGRHHTYTDVDGLDCRILLEADYLVNAAFNHHSQKAILAAKESFFRTETGIRFLQTCLLK